MIPARRLAHPARSTVLRRLGSRSLSSLASQATTDANGGRPWWSSSSSALPVALMAFGAGALMMDVHDQDWRSRISSVLSTQVARAEEKKDDDADDDDETTDVINWSGTHQVSVANKHYFEPETIQEVEQMIKDCHEKGQTVRPLGSSLSPNGVALNKDGMISMANLDKVLEIDTKNKTITVQAGIPVREVVEALRPYNLTLPNLASIAEQQMGGFTQIGAHGTGKRIAPVDQYVTKLKMVTPGKGTIELSRKDGRLFELARLAIGCLGVVVEITMECVPAHLLIEHTYVLTREEVAAQKIKLLEEHKHTRFMWIPYTDAVIVVTNDEFDPSKQSEPVAPAASGEKAKKPLTDLLNALCAEHGKEFVYDDVKGMGFGELRDALLAFAPLDVEHVKRCNSAEAEFWKNSEGYQIRPSDELLQFDCGGQQWVYEVCFGTGTQDKNNNNDMEFMAQLLRQIEENNIPAHSPIEQRWSCGSASPMSPASGSADDLYSWVGIINYLPSEDPHQREAITHLFNTDYTDLVRHIGRPMKAVSHWAKLEEPTSVWKAVELKTLYLERFPLTEFNLARGIYDPDNILSNPLLDLVLGKPIPPDS